MNSWLLPLSVKTISGINRGSNPAILLWYVDGPHLFCWDLWSRLRHPLSLHGRLCLLGRKWWWGGVLIQMGRTIGCWDTRLNAGVCLYQDSQATLPPPAQLRQETKLVSACGNAGEHCFFLLRKRHLSLKICLFWFHESLSFSGFWCGQLLR